MDARWHEYTTGQGTHSPVYKSKYFSATDYQIFDFYRAGKSIAGAGPRPALAIIDAVEAFFGPDDDVVAAQEVFRTACGKSAWRALPKIAQIRQKATETNLLVIFTTMPLRNVHGTRVYDNRPVSNAVTRGSDYAENVISGLAPIGPAESLLRKPSASAFSGTPLARLLIQRSASGIILTGGTTSGCIRATAMDAAALGFGVTVAADACFDRVSACHEVALTELSIRYARVATTDELLSEMSII